MDQVWANLQILLHWWLGIVHQLVDKQGFAFVVAVWIGIATVLVPNTRPARDFGIALFVIAAIFAVCWLLPMPNEPYFSYYNQASFRFAVPADLPKSEQTAQGTLFHGAVPHHTLLLSSGEFAGNEDRWIGLGYKRDATTATEEHVSQPNATPKAYIYPALTKQPHTFAPGADYYVVSWDDRRGIDHYVAVAAVQNGESTKWARYEIDAPVSYVPACKRSGEYMLDTLLVSAGLKFIARDPDCPITPPRA